MILTTCAVCAVPLPDEAPTTCARMRHEILRIAADTATGAAATAKFATRSQAAAARNNTTRTKSTRGGRRCRGRRMRRGHRRSDVLHLSGGRLGRGPRARVRVPRGGGFRARVVPGASRRRFGRGGRGEGFGRRRLRCEVGAVDHMRPVQARLPRRREMRARLGLLEDVRGAAGGGRFAGLAIDQLGNGLVRCRSTTRSICVRADLAVSGALAPEGTCCAFRATLQTTYHMLGRAEEAMQMEREIYTIGARKSGEEHEETLKDAFQLRDVPSWSRGL